MASPKLRFKEFAGDWDSVCLLEISSLVTKGTTPRQFVNGDINFLKIEAITENEFDLSKCQTINSEIHHKELKRSILKEGDILFAIAGATIGKNAIIQKELLPANTNQALAIVRLKEGYSNVFISKVLNSPLMEKYIDSNISTGAQPNLNLKQIGDFSFNLPEVKEQTKIASFLSAVDEKISQLTQKHKLLSQYKQGMMQKLFSQQIRFKADDGSEFGAWENSYIGNECKITTGNKDTQNKVDDGLYPFFVRSQTVEKINSYSMDCEAILTSGDGVGVGKNYHYINGKFDFHQRVYCLYEFSEKLIGKYLYIYFSNHFYDRVKRLSAKNSVDSVRMDMISKMEIKLPCREEQTKIANFLSAIDQKIEVVAQQIEQAKKWKKGLLQQMFV